MRFWLILAAFFVLFPFHATAQSMQTKTVEEPDSGDDPDSEVELPKNEIPRAIEEKAKKDQLEKRTDEKPPGTVGGETGFDAVVLRGLNKVAARSQTIEAPIGSVVRFGTIEIVAHSCWKSAPEDMPENAALLEISEIKQGEPPAQIFLGWMFSSSPGLSSLENPFYDVTVVKCEKAKEELSK